jgi:hypothetical protein
VHLLLGGKDGCLLADLHLQCSGMRLGQLNKLGTVGLFECAHVCFETLDAQDTVSKLALKTSHL